MSSFVLVHGSSHSPQAWDLVKSELERRHHSVLTPELPADEPGASAIRYADVIIGAISGCENPILVGHSAAGWFIPLVAARRPIRRMVFLAAVIPRLGMSFLDLLKAEPDMINPEWIGKDPRIPSIADEFLLHDCPSELRAWAHETMRIVNAQNAIVERYPLDRWPDIPSSYIVCAEDRTITPDWSCKTARSQLRCEPIELPGGHCPYISRPAALAQVLSQIADL